MIDWRCKNCGIALEPDHIGKCPNCGETGKAYTVTVSTYLGVSAEVAADVSRKLPKKERKLWEKFATSLKDTIIVDGFEIGFPSGIKIIFKVKKET